MGFMDRAKELAEQAQQKLDEQQAKFNESQRASHAPPPPPGATAPPSAAAAPPPPPGPPAPPAAALDADAETRERIAPPTLSSGDPLKRP